MFLECCGFMRSTLNLAAAQSSKTPGDAMGDKRDDKSDKQEMTETELQHIVTT